MKVNGAVDRRFGAVADAFARNFAERGEEGAAVCVYVGGRPVVDLWAGLANREAGREWQRDTMVVTNSTTKGFTATVAHVLAERGLLDFDAPVASYWPEFAANGKQDIPVRWVLSHRAGIPALDQAPQLKDVVAWTPVVAAVARQKPLWVPGTAHGYHAQTFGWMVGEIVRRITGKTIGRFYAEEICVAVRHRLLDRAAARATGPRRHQLQLSPAGRPQSIARADAARARRMDDSPDEPTRGPRSRDPFVQRDRHGPRDCSPLRGADR
jgi:CubicO group peptidase (beta-lactamase class C family)